MPQPVAVGPDAQAGAVGDHHRAAVRAWASRRGVVLEAVTLRAAAARRRLRSGLPADRARRLGPAGTLDRYCETNKVDPSLAAVGHRIIKEQQ